MPTESKRKKAQANKEKQKKSNALDKEKAKKQSKNARKQAKKERNHEGPSWFKRVLAHCEDLDGKILILYGLLLTIGLLMVTTASSYLATSSGQVTYYYLERQGLFAVAGIIAIFLIYIIKPEIWRHQRFQKLMYIGVTVLLVFTFIFGETINGAQGWIGVGAFSIQPVEFAKPALVLLVANFLAKDEVQKTIAEVNSPFKLIAQYKKEAAAIGIWVALVFFFPDVGGVLILGSLFVILLLNSGLTLKWLTKSVLAAIVVYISVIIILNLFDLSHIDNYQIARFTSFINPFADAQDTGLQLVYGYYALSNGGILGRGAGNSIQKLGYLPEAHNDFIMAIIGEEFGLWGVMLVLVLYFALVVYIFHKAIKMHRIYDQTVLVGVGSYFLIQAFVNLGGVLGLIPLTGVTFPFMSYGGSSLLVTSMMTGIALSVIASDRSWRRSLRAKKAKPSQAGLHEQNE
ncbi:Cell division protein FtsW [Aerococcus viridans]|uniref:Probable peptidoglycan glycosyltransferase FtsW n=2 Tax=Aerococcus viridans TaxID=1377 RepID=A0AAU8U9W6_9LACT|nr:FtsW/RodA/SpoVE family cell cycle protein [Aerococcus viridans]AMC01450.1 cell division protein FtsW [Aerococcus viridans]EFG50098.1 cell cycle protein, FtsW/RodA/SpoVE family [Aerococcus viridans ATCC 11563 = CCUG 4311]SUU15207.1 Cell division protein FtsW [Aerococcus viridans]